EQQLLLDQIAQRDAMSRRVNRLELRGRAIRLGSIGDERDAPCALDGQLERLETTLAHELSPSGHRHICHRQSPLALEAHMSRNATLRARKVCAQPRKLGERNLEVESGPPIGEQVDFTQLRPVLRHGARMIGTTPFGVKASLRQAFVYLSRIAMSRAMQPWPR